MQELTIDCDNGRTLVIRVSGQKAELYVCDPMPGSSRRLIGCTSWRALWNSLRSMFVLNGEKRAARL